MFVTYTQGTGDVNVIWVSLARGQDMLNVRVVVRAPLVLPDIFSSI